MNKDELITKQQLEIENFKEREKTNAEILRKINYRFIGIGQPLNDNCLKFNQNQLKWCTQVHDLIEQLEIPNKN
jgi:hypothetical protein